jgi:hypothetical protein
MLPGQLAADSYEDGQLHPGDYEAQVSQRPISIHGLEHLGATDRGITMFRRQIRRGIRAVAQGEDPPGLVRNGGTPRSCARTTRSASILREVSLMIPTIISTGTTRASADFAGRIPSTAG